MTRLRTLCSISMLLVFTSLTPAQVSLSIPNALERTIKRKEPSWSLIFVSVRKTKEEDNTDFVWASGAQRITIRVNEYAAAVPRFTSTSFATEAARARTLLKDIGDEAYLLGPHAYTAAPVFDVVFRKGKVMISVEAGSAENAQRFAKDVAQVLPAT